MELGWIDITTIMGEGFERADLVIQRLDDITGYATSDLARTPGSPVCTALLCMAHHPRPAPPGPNNRVQWSRRTSTTAKLRRQATRAVMNPPRRREASVDSIYTDRFLGSWLHSKFHTRICQPYGPMGRDRSVCDRPGPVKNTPS